MSLSVPALHITPRPDNADKQAAMKLRAERRVQLPDFLELKDAERLYHCLAKEISWQVQSTDEGKKFELFPNQVAAMTPQQWDTLHQIVHKTARHGFQYFYDGFPIYESRQSGTLKNPTLMAAYDLINSEAFLSLMRRLTGVSDIAFADCQATRYGPGQFLTLHDDDVAGKKRVAAYVLNLTPHWRVDWGGVLEFYDDGRPVGGYVPGFNLLNLFMVPTEHAVTYVTPFAGGYRYALTGWLRRA